MKKILSLFLVFILSITLLGCSSNANHKVVTKINETLTKVQNVVSYVEVIPKNTLIINDIMDADAPQNEQNFSEYGNGYDGATFTNAPNINKYVAKLYSLSNTAQNAITANNNTEILIAEISSKANNIQSACSLLNKKDCHINDNQTSAINELCSNIILNVNRLNISKDELKAETNNLSAIKQNYTNNVDKLSSRYTRLTNCIETRNIYLSNICNNMNNIYSIIFSCCYEKDCSCDVKQTWSNIDTYQNARKKRIRTDRVNNSYPTNGYYNYGFNGYGHGGTNPFYNYGYGMMNRFGGYGRYPYSPYSNYNPYMPNIDTFGTYTNVNTYENPYVKTSKNEEIKQDEETNQNTVDGEFIA